MLAWLKRLFEPLPRSDSLRMPTDQRESDRIFHVYDGQNGRYYIVADVVFANGEFVPDVIFHGDTKIAAALRSVHKPLADQFYGREIKQYLVVRDRSCGADNIPDATNEDRERFRQQNAG